MEGQIITPLYDRQGNKVLFSAYIPKYMIGNLIISCMGSFFILRPDTNKYHESGNPYFAVIAPAKQEVKA
jgi:hypothetical protein